MDRTLFGLILRCKVLLSAISILTHGFPTSRFLGSRPCFSPPYYFLSAWMENSRPPSPSNYLPLPKYPVFPTLHPPTIGERARPRRAPSPPKATEDEHKKQDPLTHRFSDSPRDTAVAPEYQSPRDSSSRRRRGVGERTSEESMAKRIRRESPSASHKSKLPSSPESDSQADLADNEMDAKATDMKEQAEPAPAPKKKRTRTLTTPHQSAVLHALLAQSRFPTTAMREEVGRSIGLSARKVQIWFQNQRQKARRPRNQGSTVVNRTQYGPFASVAESSSSVNRFEDHGTTTAYYSGRHPIERSNIPPDIPGLLGPGMPGAPMGYPIQGYRQVLPTPPTNAPVGESSCSGSPTGYTIRQSARSSVHRPALPSVRPSPSPHMDVHERASRTLPPLLPTPSSSNTMHTFAGHPNLTQYSGHSHHRSLSPEQRFAHYTPESSSRVPLGIPPPFTLQPAPQWDESAYHLRPSTSWSTLSSYTSRGGSRSPLASRRDSMGNINREGHPDSYYLSERRSLLHASMPSGPSASASTPQRSGRYDPIRATFLPSAPPVTFRHVRGEESSQSDRDERPIRDSTMSH